MRRIVLTAALALSVATGYAADASKPDARAAQQSRMKNCNADAKAKSLKGDERKAFMGECLKKKG